MPSLPGGPNDLPQRILTASEGGHIRRNLYTPLSVLATSPKVSDYVAIAGFPLHCLDLCFVRTKTREPFYSRCYPSPVFGISWNGWE